LFGRGTKGPLASPKKNGRDTGKADVLGGKDRPEKIERAENQNNTHQGPYSGEQGDNGEAGGMRHDDGLTQCKGVLFPFIENGSWINATLITVRFYIAGGEGTSSGSHGELPSWISAKNL